ncbi:hypothetical protein Goari_019290 [Gossypium aridum]|uniref:Uncharacterized protein n=2 Tax=Gossypium TaxID=3633 RepID=A0A7J8WSP3_GOSAI|nr:hypothetical protein [Gossypium aridum]
MNSFKIQTFGMLRPHWSTMLLSRCTRRIEIYGKLYFLSKERRRL